MKAVAVIQARMGSSRLPGKVLKPLYGSPMLTRVVERARRAEGLSDVVVATTTLRADDVIERLCKENRWHCFRGSEADVLDRYYQAAVKFQADAVVRITSDCPFIDTEIIDSVVHEFRSGQPDVEYVSNLIPTRTYPRGLDVQIIRFDTLENLWRQDTNPKWREHVTYYLDLHPEQFCIRTVTNETDYSSMRWTVDTPEDLKFARQVYRYFRHDRFTWREMLSAVVRHPDWADINQSSKTEDFGLKPSRNAVEVEKSWSATSNFDRDISINQQPAQVDTATPLLRKAVLADAEPIWNIINDPDVVKNRGSQEPIPLGHHIEWFTRRLSHSAACTWVAELEGEVVGQVRYDKISDRVAEVGFVIAKGHRARGIGTWMLQETALLAFDELKVFSLRGIVLGDNQPSLKAFGKAGYHHIGTRKVNARNYDVFEFDS